MSLDVYLTTPGQPKQIQAKIFIRENGGTREITAEEWNQRFPDREPIIMQPTESETVYSSNITHNLAEMAEQAGIYKHLWRPEELGVKTAKELIEPIRVGLSKLVSDPEKFKKFDAKNGWGTYEHFVPWVQQYLEACVAYPDATVEASR